MVTQCIVCFLGFDHPGSVGKSNYLGIYLADIQFTMHTHCFGSLTYNMMKVMRSYHYLILQHYNGYKINSKLCLKVNLNMSGLW